MASLPTVKLDTFEGPFDLVLELAQQRRLNVTALNLRQITDDFLNYVKGGGVTPELLGDFLVVAATLLLLKVKQLLPTLEASDEAEVANLTERLEAYRPFREVAARLQAAWGTTVLLSGGSFAPEPRQVQGEPATVHVDVLVAALSGLVARLPKPIAVRAHLRPRGRSLSEWLEVFAKRLALLRELVFQKTVEGGSRQDVAVSFLAVLELARKQEVTLSQESFDRELIIRKV